jgi:hypothetical protein
MDRIPEEQEKERTNKTQINDKSENNVEEVEVYDDEIESED